MTDEALKKEIESTCFIIGGKIKEIAHDESLNDVEVIEKIVGLLEELDIDADSRQEILKFLFNPSFDFDEK